MSSSMDKPSPIEDTLDEVRDTFIGAISLSMSTSNDEVNATPTRSHL